MTAQQEAPAAGAPGLGGRVRRALAWAGLNNVLLRLGSLLLGVFLARLLTPHEFGVFAVALTVQLVMMTLADLGLSADLIRAEDPDRRAPTVATLGLVTGTTLMLLGVLGSRALAAALGSPESSGAIAVLSGTLLLSGAGVVPFARLQRQFRQKRLFVIAAADLAVQVAVTVGLVLAGWGAMGLAVGNLAAAATTVLLQYRLSGTRPRFAVHRDVVRSVLAFGTPVALANLLSWVLLGVDNVIVARIAGPEPLGFYVLAFNVSTWPMTVVGQTVRSVALPAFVHSGGGRRDGLALGLRLTCALALPAGALLACLSGPLVDFVYGHRWAAAAPVLAGLAMFGALRVVTDLFVSYLYAAGSSRSVMQVQLAWLAVLTPALVAAVSRYGIVGAALAHLAVLLVVVLPGYGWALRRCDIAPWGLARSCWPALAAVVPAALAALGLARAVDGAFAELLLGGAAGLLVYAACLYRWVRRTLRPRDAPIAVEGHRRSPAAPPPRAALEGLETE